MILFKERIFADVIKDLEMRKSSWLFSPHENPFKRKAKRDLREPEEEKTQKKGGHYVTMEAEIGVR